MPEPSTMIVIGASAGGVEALRGLVARLPATLDAAILVVLHIGAHRSELPALLNQAGVLRASHPEQGEPIRRGRIYVAPPDHHLVVEAGLIGLTKGPRENWARPAIDPLFRSAAERYGDRVIGVILTGALNDGTAGLYAVKQRGGITIVQDPADCENPSMPLSALAHVAIDHCLPLAGLPTLLARLAGEQAERGRSGWTTADQALASEGQEMDADYKLDRPFTVTCPDCGGALARSQLGSLTQFRCHIGHVYTGTVMMRAQFAALEQSLEAAMRSLSERAELCRQLVETIADGGHDPQAAAQWEAAEAEAKAQTFLLRRVLEREWIQPDAFERAPPRKVDQDGSGH